MKGADRMYDLGCHLAALAQSAGSTSSVNKLNYTAKAILANPQAHIDALVAAGVLDEVLPEFRSVANRRCFLLVPPKPHVHDWFVSGVDPIGDRGKAVAGAYLYCQCGVAAVAPNRLPIEIPTPNPIPNS